MTPRSRRLAAVWFADIQGYTDLSSRDEEAALRAVDELQRLARDSVEAHGGHIVKYIGDAVLTVFDSADASVRAALALQERFSALGIRDCGLRVGVHLGEVVEAEDGDVYGDGVNVASRIEGQAEPGHVVVSEQVYQVLRQQAEHGFKPFGPVRLKGVEEPMWLYSVGDAEPGVLVNREVPVPDSTALYNAVTRHWPKIALGAIGAAVVAGFALRRMPGLSFQSYTFAWAVTSGGVWFLFDKAEAAMAAPTRKAAARWLRQANASSEMATMPSLFVFAFDAVFGERHLTWKCFGRSCAASVGTVLVLNPLFRAVGGQFVPAEDLGNYMMPVGTMALAAVIGNVLPDYVSLLETRWALAWAARTKRIALALVADIALTGVISLVWLTGAYTLFLGYQAAADGASAAEVLDYVVTTASGLAGFVTSGAFFMPFWFLGVLFYSAFFTSVWLWLYAASVLVSRVLLRMNDGVGFLLRVTDVERQPFRSMGFVSVIIVSCLFALGLPLVLL